SIRYREQLLPAGFGDELRANFDAQGGRWGCAAFMRAAEICVVATVASPAEVVPIALIGYGLTPREMEVALHVVRGRSTSDIARILSLTNLRVQDHLKAIFAKTSVRSRRQLVAQLFAATPPETA
ncbi:response regulator transcription factor, partial [Plantactinospora sp. WMMB334]